MEKFLKLITMLLIIFLVTSCSNSPTFDTTSDEAKKKSMEEITVKLSSKDQKRFKQTISTLYAFVTLVSLDTNLSVGDTLDALDDRLNGKTAKEIFEIEEELYESMKKRIKKNKTQQTQ